MDRHILVLRIFLCHCHVPYFLAHGMDGYLRFYPGIENLILTMLSYSSCHVWATYIGCIETLAHGRQVMSLLC